MGPHSDHSHFHLLTDTDTSMAPYSYSSDRTTIQLSNTDRKKLRKPAVEKMRRDRMNSSIEQLRSLLQEEFSSQDPNGKLEKADVLELTVSILKQRLQRGAAVSQRSYMEDPPQCWRSTLHFLSANSQGELPLQQLNHFSDAQRDTQEFLKHSPEKQSTPTTLPTIWRPW
ncbi:hypothetical protein AGOR_G00154430 [Albula goreensis]|uniref:Transcription factor HES-5 n=1 Tax=Albula goreensis TaxID=1534307 RepID=A0A8T3CYW2_9TELE|nr:hypothetical protein AGOR_G00154430 [Albula goreensis]